MSGIRNHLYSTTDHEEIRRWVEARSGIPTFALIRNHRIPLIGFTNGPFTRHVSWEEWFRAFDDGRYAFACEDLQVDGTPSHFCHLVPRDSQSRMGPRPLPLS